MVCLVVGLVVMNGWLDGWSDRGLDDWLVG
jgi:hypothetical protein